MKLYMPIISKQAAGISPKPIVGGAWCGGEAYKKLHSMFGFEYVFNSDKNWSNFGGQKSYGMWKIPWLRCNGKRKAVYAHSWIKQLDLLLQSGYKGPVGFGNEPDGWDQDFAAPYDYLWQYAFARRYVNWVRGSDPGSIQFIVGNYFRHTYDLFAKWPTGMTKLAPWDTVGLHIYFEGEKPGDPGWWWSTDFINAHMNKLRARGYTGKVWISEVGIKKDWDWNTSYRFLKGLLIHPDVSHVLLYRGFDPAPAGTFPATFGLFKNKDATVLAPAGHALRHLRSQGYY